ncbi:hypothetical protein ZIOFF_040432 [Zingiber officinale]|uniref:Uncharacterized protein n=1 Tax=Zingiber officinale TaxID=94328 RepID=A0A8J5GCL4_ZINOF|nr:hypothetical protein ZIOFF_040432 [Zingiber officinale]
MYEENELSVHMIATPVDKPTPINLVQHICWNLGGHESGSVLHHKLQISASRMTQVDDRSLPTGKIVPVHGTPFDFRSPAEVGSRISKLLVQQPDVGGYDVNYVLDRKFEGTYKMAEVEDRRSGRVLEICSDAPAMRLETGNLLDHVRGKGGHYYEKHSALCLATQGFPDAVNHPNFPSQVYSPGQTYHHDLLYRELPRCTKEQGDLWRYPFTSSVELEGISSALLIPPRSASFCHLQHFSLMPKGVSKAHVLFCSPTTLDGVSLVLLVPFSSSAVIPEDAEINHH